MGNDRDTTVLKSWPTSHPFAAQVGVRETLVLHHEVVAPLERLLVDDEIDAKLVAAAALRNLGVAADVSDLVKVARAQGRKRVIQRLFNVGVHEAMSEKKASTL